MKLLYGTGNPAKLESMRRALADLHVKQEQTVDAEETIKTERFVGAGQAVEAERSVGAGQAVEVKRSVGTEQVVRKEDVIEILGLGDMGREAPVVSETGKSPLENARQKALAYYDFYQMPVFSCDSGLYFEDLPDEVQPGVHVRTVNGTYLNDEEMLEYYTGLAKKYGNLKARYHNAICLVMDREHVYECMDESLMSKVFLITANPYSKVLHKGFPIDSLSVDIETGKYFYELGEYELNRLAAEEGFREFFRKLIGCCL